MEGLNRVILMGNLGADPELKVTQGGTSMLRLRLATSERYVDRSGQRQERTEWHSCVLWGKRAEGVHPYLSKGSRILVEGSLRTTSYDDRDGVKRYRTDIVVRHIVFAGGGTGGGGQSQGRGGGGQARDTGGYDGWGDDPPRRSGGGGGFGDEPPDDFTPPDPDGSPRGPAGENWDDDIPF